MEIFLQILVVLVLARMFGEVAERLDQSASVGELLAGIKMSPKEDAETRMAL